MEKIKNIQKNAEFKQIVKFELLKAVKKIKTQSKKEGEKILALEIIQNLNMFLPKFIDLLCIDEKLHEIIDVEFIEEKTKVLRLVKGTHQEVEIEIDVPKLKYLGKKTIHESISDLILNNFDLMI